MTVTWLQVTSLEKWPADGNVTCHLKWPSLETNDVTSFKWRADGKSLYVLSLSLLTVVPLAINRIILFLLFFYLRHEFPSFHCSSGSNSANFIIDPERSYFNIFSIMNHSEVLLSNVSFWNLPILGKNNQNKTEIILSWQLCLFLSSPPT